MQIKSAQFVISNTDHTKCPPPALPEYAFIGRSNVGKSSLINMLVERSNLAKTSSTPGKTQLINHFIINKEWYLVDLPGYGYAKSGRNERRKWNISSEKYILSRQNLMCMFVLIDSRHAPQKLDMEFMEWLGEKGIPFVMVFTKTDKLSKTQLEKNLKLYNSEMLKTWEALPQQFYTSTLKNEGQEDILEFIGSTNMLFTRS